MSKEIDGDNYPLKIVQGTTFIGEYELGVQINKDPFVPTDISNAVISGSIKKEYTDPDILADFIVTVMDAPNGLFRLTITDEVSVTFPAPASLKYDVRADWADGSVQSLFRGNLLVLQGIE